VEMVINYYVSLHVVHACYRCMIQRLINTDIRNFVVHVDYWQQIDQARVLTCSAGKVRFRTCKLKLIIIG